MLQVIFCLRFFPAHLLFILFCSDVLYTDFLIHTNTSLVHLLVLYSPKRYLFGCEACSSLSESAFHHLVIYLFPDIGGNDLQPKLLLEYLKSLLA